MQWEYKVSFKNKNKQTKKTVLKKKKEYVKTEKKVTLVHFKCLIKQTGAI